MFNIRDKKGSVAFRNHFTPHMLCQSMIIANYPRWQA
ncbi:hypothetical protein T11_12688 [Trichinella zimbabwensis]|uniref:Uncharacterized protein n=1 Tax=Trichinella zimbabwensis TaxID=268475 RepID=A0A0V1GL84_9BILA|nr:hypothetical protein T11_10042 [Trichinella zimbabwensis]KRY99438.1 hypothetical protein T11_12688 [Trichinella zimbabwensis]